MPVVSLIAPNLRYQLTDITPKHLSESHGRDTLTNFIAKELLVSSALPPFDPELLVFNPMSVFIARNS